MHLVKIWKPRLCSLAAAVPARRPNRATTAKFPARGRVELPVSPHRQGDRRFPAFWPMGIGTR